MFVRWCLLPMAVYLALFVLFYHTPMAKFNTDVFADAGDGLQNVWNDWWVSYSVTHLHHHPWSTQMLHFPHGTSLLGQTLNPFNGFIAIPLLWVFSLIQTYNLIFILSFVLAGLTAFWLCHELTKSYWASLVGGGLFTFSSYHVAHAVGHMQLVSIEWIPLFLLFWLRFWLRPRYLTALAAAGSLFLVLLCDYYYFFYSVLAAVLMVIYFLVIRRRALFRRSLWGPLATFVVAAGVLTAPLVLKLLNLAAHDPLSGSHPAELFGTDLLAIVFPGPSWYFNPITEWAWRMIPGGSAETSVSLGVSVMVLVGASFVLRRRLRGVGLWYTIMIFFGLMSLGPFLRFYGNIHHNIPLPYQLLAAAFPSLQLSGVPVRMMSMVALSAAVISAMVLSTIHLRAQRDKLAAAVLIGIMIFEFWPTGLTTTPVATYPNYVNALHSLPAGAVIDEAAITASYALYYQTIHQKPIAYGYISRTPQSVDLASAGVSDAERRGDYAGVCSFYHIRYLAQKQSWVAKNPGLVPTKVAYADHQSIIYDLKDGDNCTSFRAPTPPKTADQR